MYAQHQSEECQQEIQKTGALASLTTYSGSSPGDVFQTIHICDRLSFIALTLTTALQEADFCFFTLNNLSDSHLTWKYRHNSQWPMNCVVSSFTTHSMEHKPPDAPLLSATLVIALCNFTWFGLCSCCPLTAGKKL